MLRIFKLATVVMLPLALTACGSVEELMGEGGGDGFDGHATEAKSLLVRTWSLAPTGPDAMPSGNARYEGYTVLSHGEVPRDDLSNVDVMSKIGLDVDFSSGELTGNLYDFETSNLDANPHGAGLLQGTISGDGFNGSLTGDYNTGEGQRYDFETDVDGRFFGQGASMAGAGFEGTATSSNGQTSEFYGSMAAERQ